MVKIRSEIGIFSQINYILECFKYIFNTDVSFCDTSQNPVSLISKCSFICVTSFSISVQRYVCGVSFNDTGYQKHKYKIETYWKFYVFVSK